jgi:hypothetical protein
MRDWQGIRADLTAVADDGLAMAKNVSFKVEGELRRRPGLDGDDIVGAGGELLTEWTDFLGLQYLMVKYTSTLTSVRISSGTQTTVASGLHSNRGCFARANGRLYFTNDFNAVQRITDGTVTAGVAGISAPSAAIGSPSITGSGLCDIGIKGLRYRYFDSKSLYMSDPSDQINLTLVSGTTISISIGTGSENVIRSQDAKVDQVIIELTDSGSSKFYRAATVNQTLTGTTISMNDVTLRLQVSASRDGDFGHQPPPLVAMMTEHRGRLFGLGTTVATITGVTVSTAAAASFSVTGSTFSSGWAGRLVKVGSDTKSYRITTMSGNAVMVLSEAYTGTAGVATGIQVYSAQPDMLFWTRAGFPESWDLLRFARRVMQNDTDTPSGMFSLHEVLYILGQRSVRTLDYKSDPASAALLKVPTDMGCWNKNCIVEANGRVYVWGRSGAWTSNGLVPKHISGPVDDLIDGSTSGSTDDYDVSQYEEFHGVYDPWERCVSWFYCTSSETGPKHAITLDVDSGKWRIDTFKHAITASTLTTGGTTQSTRALLSVGSAGYSWYLKPDVFDAVPAVMSGGVVTISNTGSTTTILNVTESLPTGTPELFGAILVYSGQEREIISNTANTITVTPALSAAPTQGTEAFIGQIDVSVKTKFTAFDGLNKLKRPNYLMIGLIPGSSAGKLTVKIYLDHSTTPFVFTKGGSDTQPDGVSWTHGASYVSVDLDGGNGAGVAFVPLPDSWNRVVAAEISTTRPQNLFRWVDYKWVFKDARGSVDTEGG